MLHITPKIAGNTAMTTTNLELFDRLFIGFPRRVGVYCFAAKLTGWSCQYYMLVSKIKPCMSKYKHLYCETANGSLNQLSFIWMYSLTTWITVVILEQIHAKSPDSRGKDVSIRLKTNAALRPLLTWWFIVTVRIAWPSLLCRRCFI